MAFQGNAFQGNAFQIGIGTAPPTPIICLTDQPNPLIPEFSVYFLTWINAMMPSGWAAVDDGNGATWSAIASSNTPGWSAVDDLNSASWTAILAPRPPFGVK